MAIAYDKSSEFPDWGGGTSVSCNISPTASSGNFLFAIVEVYSSADLNITGCTYDGAPMTAVGLGIKATLTGANQNFKAFYIDAAPGAVTVATAASFSGSADFASIQVGVWTGKTTTGLDSFAYTQDLSGSVNSPTCNTNVVHTDCWLIGGGYSRFAGTATAGSGTTSRRANAIGHILGDSNGVVGTGNQSLNFVVGGSSTWPGVVMASISEADAGGGGGPIFMGQACLSRRRRYFI